MKSLYFILVVCSLANVILSEKVELRTPKCCKIDMPQQPFFTSTGELLGYQPQPCPAQYLICCKGLINISGTCIELSVATAYLPIWQSVAQQLGISLLEAIEQSGVLVG